MEIRTATDYQAALLELKRLITETREATGPIAALAEALDNYEISVGYGPVRST